MSREKTLPTRSERVSRHRALFGICMLLVWACWGLRRFPFGCRICSYLSGISEAPQAALGWRVPTMVLSETQGLWLCWVVRGGIRWPMRLSAERTQPNPPKDTHPRTRARRERFAVSWALKPLVISVVPDRTSGGPRRSKTNCSTRPISRTPMPRRFLLSN